MKDPRMVYLAKNLVNYSCAVKPGEKVLVECIGQQNEFVAEIVRQIYAAGGIPLVQLKDPLVERALGMGFGKEQLEFMAEIDSLRMKGCQAYIGIRAGDNNSEQTDIPKENLSLYNQLYGKPVHSDIRIPHTKWVVLRYPTASMAQQASMSTEAFEDFYFDVCNLDYGQMSKAMDALVEKMEKTDQVRITGPGTELTFSIKGQSAIKCDGKVNIPDGEVFTAPIKNSVNGVLTFNTPSLYQGTTFENISFTFENGKIVKAIANQQEALEHILNTDEGARYIGEFAVGVNPFILIPMKDTLFDEKIAGSFHFTPGNCYDEAPNGNKSAIHWDMVCIQRKEYGGGKIYFDGELIRKDGLFIPDILKGLNPDAFAN